MDAEWRTGVMEHATGMHVTICIYMCCVGGYRQKCSVIIYVVRPDLFLERQNAIFRELCMVMYTHVLNGEWVVSILVWIDV